MLLATKIALAWSALILFILWGWNALKARAIQKSVKANFERDEEFRRVGYIPLPGNHFTFELRPEECVLITGGRCTRGPHPGCPQWQSPQEHPRMADPASPHHPHGVLHDPLEG